MNDKCLNPNCKNCYNTASKLVREKKITWEALVKKGRALEVKSRSATKIPWFLS
jgi:hypothetical protein